MLRPSVKTLLGVLLSFQPLLAQIGTYNPEWYVADQPHVKLLVGEDGIYRVDASDLAAAGMQIGSVDPATLRLLENGREIPIWYDGDGEHIDASDSFLFVGRRNSGADEAWVYNYDDSLRSSAHRSLYTDTTTYFLTWGGPEGLRYAGRTNDAVSGAVTDRVRVQGWIETDDVYFFGVPESSGNPLYTLGEGYYMYSINHGDEVIRRNIAVSFTDLTRGDSDTLSVQVRLRGSTKAPHLGFIDIVYQDPGSSSVTETAFDSVAWNDYGSATLAARLSQTSVPGNGKSLQLRVGSDNSVGAQPNAILIDYVSYSYLRSLSPEAGQFEFGAMPAGAVTFQLSGSPDTDVIVLVPESSSRFDLKGNGTFGDAAEPKLSYWLTTPSDVKQPIVKPDVPSDLASTSLDADYLIISAAGLMESAQRLADYRTSQAGGLHRVLVVNVTDVFDQFDYGRQTPIAIKRFIDQARSWSGHPDFVTIWGDALYPDTRRARFDWEVPSFGNASSDGWFAMNSGGNPNDYFESVALGRITVRENAVGDAFVDKIRRYESQPPDRWQKRIIMMSGGVNTGEQQALTGITDTWGQQIADAPFGGDVTYFHKTSEAVLDPTFLDSVDAAITKGSGLLSFFGHSAADTWEIVTESPVVFNNSQTLPVVVSLGCFTGAYARGDGSRFDLPPFAELLVTQSQNGSIAHYGGSTSSTIIDGSQIADPFFDIVFMEGERVLGSAVAKSKQRYLSRGLTSARIETALQYNLIGDPATRMSFPTLPDLHVDQRSVTVTPAAPVAGIDSTMTVTVAVENRGLVPEDSLTVRLIRTSPGGAASTYRTRLQAFPLLEKASFVLPIAESDIGQNEIETEVDADHEISEDVETDNAVQISQFVFGSGVVQFYPPDFGLVTTQNPSLRFGKASATQDRLTAATELDTTDRFDSGLLINEKLEAGGFSEWTPATNLVDGSTYYWRIAPDADETPKWRQRTFTVRKDLPYAGWLQQGPQFEQNDHGEFLTYFSSNWHLRDFGVDVRIRSAQSMSPALNTIIVGGFEHETLAIGFAVVIVSIDGLFKSSGSFVPYPNRRGRDVAEERQKMRDFIASAEEREYVFINSRLINVSGGDVLPDETKEVFRELGSTQIDSVDLNDLWNFAFRVGDDEPLVDVWQDRDPDVGPHILWSDLTIPIRFLSGDSQSPPIGPATQWHEFQMTGVVYNPQSFIRAFVLSADGDTLGSQEMDFPGGTERIDLSPAGLNVDANEYPFLRLALTLTDSTRFETPQLTSWYMGYDPVSELVVDAPAFATPIDTVSEGEPVDVSVNVVNGGPAAIDSVFVSYTVTDANNGSSLSAVDTVLSLQADATIESKASIATVGKAGVNRVTVVAQQRRGPEPAAFNNTAIGNFTVLGDKTPPTFSLTVDGATYPNDPRVITSTDDPTLPFFSAHPIFEISVTDDNPYLSLTDTSVINLLLDDLRIDFSRPDVQFEPASTDRNEATLIFTPDFSNQDTTHTLKAWAQDQSGNREPTREDPYTLSFRVQEAAEIENLYPYPNPMHNFTRFMFRLRGSDPSLVEDLRIRVYTISGRPVREFDLLNDPALLEDGGLRIGWNRLLWDGRDEDGDLLATGIYLYKVFLRAEGRDMSVNNDRSIEKIAIIR